ncbi:MAG: murein biosynthesis integral membrane protein MurJ [Actinomycetota bacterium]
MTSLKRATAFMTLGTLLSRVTGLARITAIAAALGIAEKGSVADTFNLANTAPTIIYELILGGILTSVFVPVFVELVEKEGRERAWEVASALINLSLVILVAITVIGIATAPLIAKFYTLNVEGDRLAEQREALTFLLRLFIPQIIFYGLTALTAGLLNAHKRFGAPMYTPVLNNLGVIAVFLSFWAAYGRVTLETVSTGQLLVIGLGTTAGVALMAVAQIPFLRGLGRYRFTLRNGGTSVRKLARLSLFVIGYAVANQVGYTIVQVLAAGQAGAYAAYFTAFIFFMLPHGLFAVSIITALLPGMSSFAVKEDWVSFRSNLSTGIRTTLLLILPAAVGYMVLGEPIVRLILEHGNSTALSTDLVVDVLRFFVIGLVPFSLFQLFLRAFYALQDPKTPFLVNCVAVAFNVAIDFPLFAAFGVEGLAAGHAASYIFGVIVLGLLLQRRIGGMDARRIIHSGWRIGASAALMGLTVLGVYRAIDDRLDSDRLIGQLAEVFVPVAVGAASYAAFTILFRVEETSAIKNVLRGRFGREDR